jgi:hypothetical protein
LRSRILNTDRLTGKGVGRLIQNVKFTRSICFDDDDDDDGDINPGSSMYESLVVLALATPRLQSFRMIDLIAPPILSHLVQTCGQTLTSLRITVSDARFPALLSSLTSLEDLSLVISDPYLSFRDTQIILPHVRTFALEWSAAFDTTVIARSRLHPNCAVELDMRHLGVESAKKLLPFFSSHSFSSVTLKISPLEAVNELADAVRLVPVLRFSSFLVPLNLFNSNPIPRDIHIDMTVRDATRMEDIFMALHGRPVGASDPTKLHLTFSETEWSWKDEMSHELTLVRETLALVARDLQEQGIVVVDKDGLDVSSMKQ